MRALFREYRQRHSLNDGQTATYIPGKHLKQTTRIIIFLFEWYFVVSRFVFRKLWITFSISTSILVFHCQESVYVSYFFIATNLRVMLFFVILPMYKITTDTIPFYIILIFIYWFFRQLAEHMKCVVFMMLPYCYTHIWGRRLYETCTGITTNVTTELHIIVDRPISYNKRV